jgi:hypothetical protein
MWVVSTGSTSAIAQPWYEGWEDQTAVPNQHCNITVRALADIGNGE